MNGMTFKRARLALGLDRDQMADMLGYAGSQKRQQISDLETERRPMREPQRRLMEAYLRGYRPDDWPVSGHSEPVGRNPA